MDRYNSGKEKLNIPTDFTSRKPQDDLVPPSHFASSVQGAKQAVATQPCISWMNSSVPAAPSTDPWLGFTKTHREILTQRKDDQYSMMLRENTTGRTPEENVSDLRTRSKERGDQWSRWEAEWCLEAERHKAEAEQLKEQMEALKDTVQRHGEEIRVKNDTINRQCHDLKTMTQEMSKVRTEQRQLKEELTRCHTQKEKINLQLEQIKKESDEEIAKMKSQGHPRELALKAKMSEQQAAEAREQTLKMVEKIQQMQKKHEEELRQLNADHSLELCSARKSNHELQNKLESATREVLQLKSNLKEASAERDELKEHLRQMEQAYETQSATLHSLRNYIGQVVADKGETQQLNEAVELNKEKMALQKTAELLTVRLNSMSEIVSLQEEKMLKKASADPLVAKKADGLLVLHLWREKVFKLCVQLRLKDIELRDEREKHLSELGLVEQQLQDERHRATVLQRSLDGRIAELDQEKVEIETLKRDLAQACKETQQLKAKSLSLEVGLKSTIEALRRFSVLFDRKITEVDAAHAKLNSFGPRLNFARGRVETVQALFMRRAALHKVQKSSKQAEQTTESITNLQRELNLVSQERSKLTQELKRTPELIEKALVDMKEEHEHKLKQLQGELEQSRDETQKAVAAREEIQRNLQGVLAQLEVSKVAQEGLQCQLLSLKENSEKVLRERVSEMESRCAEKLSEMEMQVSTAKREHTKAVMTLRQFEKAVTRKQNHWRETEASQSQRSKKDVRRKQEAKIAERELRSDFPQNISAPREPGEKSSERSCFMGSQLAAEKRLLSVMEELHALSAAVVNSSEDSAEEEEEEGAVSVNAS
ncbi:coiled-coil alpha-helical rod protein 1 isoform X2 [Syngnathus acus]|uniref:coiled-coil alpha-helical rod protein 1 isoform X2 n=1 Tax=Syngnathus acus TaxID=161584 RepID=UPI001885E5DE|nr:coiled-coil alpha-helical rod protein 1 isoform X2 [Syngnathus acus]